MKPRVIVSLEDPTGDRCVDILRYGEARFAFRECRRDPEDNHGWRHLSQGQPPFYPSYEQAFKAARKTVGWLQ